MRKLTIITLLLMVVVMPASAFTPRDSYLDNNVVVIAWSDGVELSVAIANASNNRTSITISTPTVDLRGRQVFSSTRVNVPGRTIVVENFRPATPRRNDELIVRASDGYRSINVPVQVAAIMEPESYVVQANTHWTVAVDVDFLLHDSGRTRLVIDDYYQTGDGFNRDRIRVESLQGGLSQVRGNSNTIEYLKPSLVLTMKTPNTNNLTTMTFGIRKTDGNSWRDEEIQGPIVMVYGRNIRFGGSSDSGDSGRVRY